MGETVGIDVEQLKRILGLPSDVKVGITPVSGGWNIRIVKSKHMFMKKVSFMEVLIMNGQNVSVCAKCGKHTYCQPHHIVPQSAGGLDDPDNGLFLCFDCHIGDNGLHQGKWAITDLVDDNKLFELRQRYGLIM